MVRLAVVLAFVAAGHMLSGDLGSSSGAAAAPMAPTPAALETSRDIHLTFAHGLGAAEAKRRTAARFAALQAQFAGSVASSSIVWSGNDADVRAKALGQSATAHVLVGETTLAIDVHLPVLLAPLRGNIEKFLTTTAVETLKV